MNRKIRFINLFSLFLIPIFVTACAPAFLNNQKYDPRLIWKTLETDHFSIHYHQGEEQIAQEAAHLAEEIHTTLSQKLLWQPRGRTQIVLVDTIDEVSGAASVFPYNTITVNLTPPAGSLGITPIHYQDWLRLVLTHEYTHILHLDAVDGLPEILRNIFGRVVLPNVLQPLWIIEGLATYEETQLQTSDRQSGTFAEMILRMSVLDHQFESIDRANSLDSWPNDVIPYLYGSNFLKFITDKYGEEKLAEINKRYSGQIVPFLINYTAVQTLRADYRQLWTEWQYKLTQKYQEEYKRLQKKPLTDSHALTHLGYLTLGPVISPDGERIAYSEENRDEFPQIKTMAMNGSQKESLALRNSGHVLSWTPDGSGILFTQIEYIRNNSLYGDLYLYDMKTRTTSRMTHGMRVSEADLSPDGQQIILTTNELGRKDLALLNIQEMERTKPERIFEQGSEIQYSTPRWSPDGKKIVVSAWKQGFQDIYIVELQTQTLTSVTQDMAIDLAPVWSPDGDHLLFSSDRTGIFNIFAYRLQDKSLHQITHVIGGAFMPHLSPDGRKMVFSNYSAKGFDIHLLEINLSQWHEIKSETLALPVQAPGQASGSASDQPERGDIGSEASGPPHILQSHTYNPLPTLLPRFWFPWFGGDEDGAQLGLITGGRDVLNQHKYYLTLLYGLESRRPAFDIDYLNEQLYPTLHLGLSDQAISHSDLVSGPMGETITYWERQRQIAVDVLLPILSFRTSHYLTLGYRDRHLGALTTIPLGFTKPGEGVSRAIRVGWIYSSTKNYGFSISLEEGRLISLAFEREDQRLQSDFDVSKYIADWHEYVNLPIPHQVLALRLAGTFATGDLLAQRAFQLGGQSNVLGMPIVTIDQDDLLIRGFPVREFRGQRAALASIEYRFPIANIEQGPGTLPIFLERIHGGIFLDTGQAWDKSFSIANIKTGIGGELKADTTWSYVIPLRFRLGLARGFTGEGVTQVYLALGNAF